MGKSNHKYRATIYFGKDIYEELEKMSNQFGISVATLATIIFKTGWEVSGAIERSIKDGK